MNLYLLSVCSSINIKRGREATSVGILKGARTLEQGLGRSPIIKASGGRGAPEGIIFFVKLCLKTLKFPTIRGRQINA